MKRRLATLAAMLLLTASLSLGTLGTLTAQSPPQEPVHEADGTRHKSGPVTFSVTWKGVVHVHWRDWVEGVGEDPAPVDSWVVTATDSKGKVRTKKPQGGPHQTRFGNLSMGEDYEVKIEAFDDSAASMGTQTVTIRPRHVSPPEPVRNITLRAGEDGRSVSASWTAPDSGGRPHKYAVHLTNLDTGRARVKGIERSGRGTNGGPKTETVFEDLWPGDTYRVAIETVVRDSRAGVKSPSPHLRWQYSRWMAATVVMPAGSEPDYAKVVPDSLIWYWYGPGEQEDPRVIGAPTKYVVSRNVPGGLAWFDYPNKCKEYRSDHEGAFPTRQAKFANADQARQAALNQRFMLDSERKNLADAIAAKERYERDTPESERDPREVDRHERNVARYQREVAAEERILADLTVKLDTACAETFPVVEKLTENEYRFYRISSKREYDTPER